MQTRSIPFLQCKFQPQKTGQTEEEEEKKQHSNEFNISVTLYIFSSSLHKHIVHVHTFAFIVFKMIRIKHKTNKQTESNEINIPDTILRFQLKLF